MNKQKDEFSKMKEQGLHPLDVKSVEELTFPTLSVTVEAALPDNAELKLIDFAVEIMNTRGASVILSDWATVDRNGQKLLSFVASIQVSNDIDMAHYNSNQGATSFADLCWFQGNESLDTSHTPETVTLLNREFKYVDLGMVMPSRLLDRLLVALEKANNWMLGGVLEDAIIYGVRGKNAS